MLVGSVVLLTNIDVGWLQNPIFYTEATYREVIRYLPGYFPSQVATVAAFTPASLSAPILGALGYAGGLLLLAAAMSAYKLRTFQGTRMQS